MPSQPDLGTFYCKLPYVRSSGSAQAPSRRAVAVLRDEGVIVDRFRNVCHEERLAKAIRSAA